MQCPVHIIPWCGCNHIHLSVSAEPSRADLVRRFSTLKGDVSKIKFHDTQTISYDDHVTRIVTAKSGQLDTAVFTLPCWKSCGFVSTELETLPGLSSEDIDDLSKHQQLSYAESQCFDYAHMESGQSSMQPVDVGGPCIGPDTMILPNILHIPVKITKVKAAELKLAGRVLSNSDAEIQHNMIYVPEDIKSIMPLIQHVCMIEKHFNPRFTDEYYVFVTISQSEVEKGAQQRRGGWHIDGHQGYERLQQSTGAKLPCDRQYLICNTLPTEFIPVNYNFDKLRKYCEDMSCGMDSVNMQDVIDTYASLKEAESPETVVRLKTNRLTFLNPYMTHRAAFNNEQKVLRTFIRIIFSVYPRDRLGDSVNPCLGPIFPWKVKTITDIHEIPRMNLF